MNSDVTSGMAHVSRGMSVEMRMGCRGVWTEGREVVDQVRVTISSPKQSNKYIYPHPPPPSLHNF